MEENIKQERKIIKISRKKVKTFVWLLVVVVILAILIGMRMVYTRTFSVGSSTGANIRSINQEDMMLYSPLGSQDLSIRDTREFMKTSYSSYLKTRDVSGVVKSVKNIVKGSDGRVDNFNSSEKRGYVSFVVPKSNFDEFRDEIEALTHKKLYTENISSENLLSTKQVIEENTKNTTQTLEQLTLQKNELEVNHTKNINSINKEMLVISSDLSRVRINISNETDKEIITLLRKQETTLVQQQASKQQKLNEENTKYSNEKQVVDSLIKNTNANLTDINKQDVKFADNIETVNGSVRVDWVSIWDIIKIFSPIHPTLIIIILIIAGIIIFRRKFPKVEME